MTVGMNEKLTLQKPPFAAAWQAGEPFTAKSAALGPVMANPVAVTGVAA